MVKQAIYSNQLVVKPLLAPYPIFKIYMFFSMVMKRICLPSGLLASTFTYKANTNNKYALTLSAYSTRESETYDIESAYWLQDLDPLRVQPIIQTTFGRMETQKIKLDRNLIMPEIRLTERF